MKTIIQINLNNIAKIITLLHFACPFIYFFQLFDVNCFNLIKKVYNTKIEHLIQAHITHITKENFFPAFKKAFDATITESNIKGSFRGAELVPMDPQNMFFKLDVKLIIPQTSRSSSRNASPWVSKMLQNPTETSL